MRCFVSFAGLFCSSDEAADSTTSTAVRHTQTDLQSRRNWPGTKNHFEAEILTEVLKLTNANRNQHYPVRNYGNMQSCFREALLNRHLFAYRARQKISLCVLKTKAKT